MMEKNRLEWGDWKVQDSPDKSPCCDAIVEGYLQRHPPVVRGRCRECNKIVAEHDIATGKTRVKEKGQH